MFKLSEDPRIALTQVIDFIHSHGWCPATSGNFSVVLEKSPIKLLMSPSGVDKGSISPEDLIEISQEGQLLSGAGKPSAETLLHLAVVEECNAGAVLHTHSRYNTILSSRYVKEDQLEISGLEILKAFSGVTTHEHVELVPIIPNSQSMPVVQLEVRKILKKLPKTHGFLLSGHGLYTWGKDLLEAKRHVEAFEFLFECVGTELLMSNRR